MKPLPRHCQKNLGIALSLPVTAQHCPTLPKKFGHYPSGAAKEVWEIHGFFLVRWRFNLEGKSKDAPHKWQTNLSRGCEFFLNQ